VDPQEQARIIQEYKRRQKASALLRLGVVAIGVGLMFAALEAADGGIGASLLTAVLLVALVVAGWRMFVTWRCPVCHKDLGRDLSSTYCGNCGVRLED